MPSTSQHGNTNTPINTNDHTDNHTNDHATDPGPLPEPRRRDPAAGPQARRHLSFGSARREAAQSRADHGDRRTPCRTGGPGQSSDPVAVLTATLLDARHDWEVFEQADSDDDGGSGDASDCIAGCDQLFEDCLESWGEAVGEEDIDIFDAEDEEQADDGSGSVDLEDNPFDVENEDTSDTGARTTPTTRATRAGRPTFEAGAVIGFCSVAVHGLDRGPPHLRRLRLNEPATTKDWSVRHRSGAAHSGVSRRARSCDRVVLAVIVAAIAAGDLARRRSVATHRAGDRRRRRRCRSRG